MRISFYSVASSRQFKYEVPIEGGVLNFYKNGPFPSGSLIPPKRLARNFIPLKFVHFWIQLNFSSRFGSTNAAENPVKRRSSAQSCPRRIRNHLVLSLLLLVAVCNYLAIAQWGGAPSRVLVATKVIRRSTVLNNKNRVPSKESVIAVFKRVNIECLQLQGPREDHSETQ